MLGVVSRSNLMVPVVTSVHARPLLATTAKVGYLPRLRACATLPQVFVSEVTAATPQCLTVLCTEDLLQLFE